MTQCSTQLDQPLVEAPLNIEQAAERMGVTVRYVRRMVDERRIRYLKVGRLIRFRIPDVDAYLKQAEIEPISASSRV